LCSLESNWTGIIAKEGNFERGLKRLGPLSKLTSVHCKNNVTFVLRLRDGQEDVFLNK